MKIENNRQSVLRIIAVICLFLIIMKIPFDLALEKFFAPERAYYIKKALFASIIILYSIVLIRRYRFQYITGLVNPGTSFFYIYFLPLYIGLLTNFSNFKNLGSLDIIIPFIAVTLHAFAEELTFRGIILPTLIENNKHSIKGIKKSIIISALIFGGAHFISLFRYDLISVVCQVIYATIFGLFFSVLLLKGHNIYFLGLIHGIVNFISRINSIGVKNYTSENLSADGSGIFSIVAIFVIFAPLLIVAIYMLKRITMKDISNLNV